MRYQKYNVPKHERDRLVIEEHNRLVQKARLLSQSVFNGEDPALIPLGNGCYWVRQLKADY